MCCEEQISLSSWQLSILVGLRGDEDCIAYDGTKPVNLGSKLDLDGFSCVKSPLCFFGIGGQGSVGSDIGAGRDSRWVADALGDLLALENLSNLFV